MNDGRQMVGQMLAFDKVRNSEFYGIKPPLTLGIAYEPGSCRHRRIQTRKEEANEGSRSPRLQHQLSNSCRIRRKAHTWSHDRPRRSYHLSLRRVSASSRPVCTSRRKRTRRYRYNPCSWCWNRTARRKRCSYWIGCKFDLVGRYAPK